MGFNAANIGVQEDIGGLLRIGFQHTHRLKNGFHCRPHVLLLDADSDVFRDVKSI